jgi:alpha-glucosidase
MADGGYDVADYRDVEPVFGTLAEAEKLISEALALGIRTIIDVVPNHVSAAHPWFRDALAGGPGSPARERFWFRPGRGEHGELPPNNWPSQFGGPAWTRTTNPDGTPGDWFLNLFDSEQPDLNWNHPDVRAEHEDILRFWFDRGVAGVRIDSAGLLIKDPALPEVPEVFAPGQHPTEDRDEVHDVYRAWRRIADEYNGTRVLVGEVWVPDAARFAAYLRPDEMHTAFNFDFMARPWDAAELRASIDLMLDAHAPVGAPSTWVLSNHDVTRPVTRYGREDSGFAFARKRFGTPTDLELGRRRARAAALLTAALPGSLYLYQGDELGLPEVELPREVLEDPMHFRSGGVDPGRDGCRVPLPWRGTASPFGFSPAAASAAPWLPQPAEWAALTVQAQEADPGSMLWLYRQALRIRKREAALGDGTLTWLPSEPTALVFRRGDDVVNVTNLGSEPMALPDHDRILLSSTPLVGGMLPSDSTAWLHRIA